MKWYVEVQCPVCCKVKTVICQNKSATIPALRYYTRRCEYCGQDKYDMYTDLYPSTLGV